MPCIRIIPLNNLIDRATQNINSTTLCVFFTTIHVQIADRQSVALRFKNLPLTAQDADHLAGKQYQFHAERKRDR